MLSTTTEYALRALVALARDSSDAMIQARSLADRADVPSNYLSKILAALGRAGIVRGIRGAGGGYKLARPPGQLRLIEVAELFEGNRTRPGCLLGGGRECGGPEPCSAHRAWQKVKETYMEFLEKCTLADIAGAPLAPGCEGQES